MLIKTKDRDPKSPKLFSKNKGKPTTHIQPPPPQSVKYLGHHLNHRKELIFKTLPVFLSYLSYFFLSVHDSHLIHSRFSSRKKSKIWKIPRKYNSNGNISISEIRFPKIKLKRELYTSTQNMLLWFFCVSTCRYRLN